MPGLLDIDPQEMGLLNMAFSLLSSSAPSRTPVPLGASLGQAGMAGLQGMAQGSAMQQDLAMKKIHADLYGAQVKKLAEDAKRQAAIAQVMQGNGPAPQQPVGLSGPSAAAVGAPWMATGNVPQPPPPSPAEGLRAKGQALLGAGALQEGKTLLEAANQLDNNLEFKDGVWYDKRTGSPVKGGAGINPQGFGYETSLGPNGRISVAPMQGAAATYGLQQQIGEQAKAAQDLVTVPATAPGQPPRYASRASLLQGNQPAGMSPTVAAGATADAAQQTEVSKNFGDIYNKLQNASMQNPAKMANLQRVGTLLSGHEGGTFSGTAMDIARAGNSLGIKIDAKLPAKEAAVALANGVALENRSTASGTGMPGSMSDKDLSFLQGMSPNLSQTDAGRKLIIDSRVKVMERENQVARMARQYRQKHGKLDDDFFGQLQEWSNRNALFPQE